jgi:hypothetical protein
VLQLQNDASPPELASQFLQLRGLGICTDTTFDTVGYIIADGNGNLTSVRLFLSNNAGVSDATYTGTYSITDCDNGVLTLLTGTQLLHFSIDLDSIESASAP